MKGDSHMTLFDVTFKALVSGTYRVIANDLDDATRKVEFMLTNSAKCELVEAEHDVRRVINDPTK
jgi:hypothetical protein